MNKKIITYIVVLAVLVFLLIYFMNTNSGKSTFSLEDKERYAFAVEDTSAVDRIVIRDKTPREIELVRSDEGKWLVDGKYKVRRDAIHTLLETLHRMEMRNFIPEKMQQTVIKRMVVYGKEVEIYKDGKLFKTLYIGTESQDEMATYMMLKGSDQPFAVHIPGFNGFLSSRFFTKEYLWRSREIFELKPTNIREIKMLYPDSINASFQLQRVNEDSVFIADYQSGKPLESWNEIQVNLFLAAFKRLSFEGPIIEEDPIYSRRDSLLASEPVFKLELTTTSGESKMLRGYRIKGPEDLLYTDENMQWDPDRLHGIINEDEMVLLQYYGLGNILVGKNYFLSGGN